MASIMSRELRHIAPTSGMIYIDGDTSMSPGTWEAVMRASAARFPRPDAVMSGNHPNASSRCARPAIMQKSRRRWASASSDNAAIGRAPRAAQIRHRARGGVDFDVHHGNGTQDIFWADPTVMYCSTHQMPLFPGSGARGERGEHDTIVNAPLAPEDGSAKFRSAFENLILPQLTKFSPELIINFRGLRAHYRDPLASLNLKAEDFGWVTKKLMDLATRPPAAASSRCWRAATTCRACRSRSKPMSRH